MFFKSGATTFHCNNSNTKWHLSSFRDETETELPKRLEKLVPQYSITITLTLNHTCWVLLMKLKLNCPSDWKNWCHNIQLQKNTNLKWHLSSYFYEIEIELPKRLEKMASQHSVALTLTRNHACQVILMKLKLSYSNVWKTWCHKIQSQ